MLYSLMNMMTHELAFLKNQQHQNTEPNIDETAEEEYGQPIFHIGIG